MVVSVFIVMGSKDVSVDCGRRISALISNELDYDGPYRTIFTAVCIIVGIFACLVVIDSVVNLA